MNYYVSETVQEAYTYRDYAKQPSLSVADIRLAISSKSFDSFTRPLPMSTIKPIAQQKNTMPLPKIESIAALFDEKP